MAVVVVVGAQWGDEGKGKVVDLYTEQVDAVIRYGGGANAGHTIIIDGVKLVTHLIPSGVAHPGKQCILGEGMVIDPHALLDEIDACKGRGLLPDDRDLLLAERAHVILPYHKLLDERREARKHALGTTKRGIGPAYEAKVGRRGVRVGDLVRPARLRALVEQNLDEVGPLLAHLGATTPGVDEIVEPALAAGERLRPYLADVSRHVTRAMRAGRSLLFEGAQGALLDIDHGTYPYVTSSSTLAAGACLGVGIGPTCIDRVVGVSKAYATRVGGGPFPTELAGEAADRLREAGGEFGATTGRPRRCGWLDMAALRLAIRLNGMTGLALTKLDVLRGLPRIDVCVGYRLDSVVVDELPLDPEDIVRAEPVYESFAGWTEETREARDLDDLPSAARAYVAAVEELAGVPACLVSVGPSRSDTIVLQSPFA